MIVSNFPGGSDVFALPLDGSKEMTGDLKLGGNQIKNIGAPEEETDAARKQEVTDHNKSEDAHANILSDMVKATGGATMTMGETIGVGPYDIQITEDEDGEISASDVSYDNRASGMTATDVQGAVTELFTSVSNGKNLIAGAITDKGVSTSGDATFRQMADNIGAIETGTDTSDATATSGDILSGKTAYGASGKLTGTIPTVEQATPTITVSSGGMIVASASQSAGYTTGGDKSATKQLNAIGGVIQTPGTENILLAQPGDYVIRDVLVKGDANLVPENIKSGVSIFGVDGSFEGSDDTVTLSINKPNLGGKCTFVVYYYRPSDKRFIKSTTSVGDGALATSNFKNVAKNSLLVLHLKSTSVPMVVGVALQFDGAYKEPGEENGYYDIFQTGYGNTFQAAFVFYAKEDINITPLF